MEVRSSISYYRECENSCLSFALCESIMSVFVVSKRSFADTPKIKFVTQSYATALRKIKLRDRRLSACRNRKSFLALARATDVEDINDLLLKKNHSEYIVEERVIHEDQNESEFESSDGSDTESSSSCYSDSE